jgi:hypothetical protein
MGWELANGHRTSACPSSIQSPDYAEILPHHIVLKGYFYHFNLAILLSVRTQT